MIRFFYNIIRKIARPLGLEKVVSDIGFQLSILRSNLIASRKVPLVPELIFIEPTNTCNLNCIMCDRKLVEQRKMGFMDFDLFTKIIDEAANLGVAEIDFGVGGEPLLHPRLFDMLKYAKSKGLRVSLSTNANLLDEQKSQAILTSGLDQIIFSVDGATKETYERIRRGGNYDTVVGNIKKFLSLKKKLGLKKPKTVFQTIIMKSTESEVKEVVATWQPFVDKISVVPVAEYGNIRGLSLLQGKVDSPKIPCALLWLSMTILWNGDVALCCDDIGGEIIFGNLEKNYIRNIWNGDKLNKIRKIHQKHEFEKIPRCNRCEAINIDLIKKKRHLVLDT